jgi:TRAP-type C4-dicarboxylate transport system permease small subunit
MFRILEKASDGAFFVGKWLTFVYIAAVTVLSILGVIFRSAGSALTWNEELMRWLLVSLAYIGASVGMRTRNHIGIEFFLTRMKFTVQKILIIIGYIAIVLFLIIVLVYGFQVAMSARRQLGSIVRIPMVYVKMNLPLGSLLMLTHILYLGVGIFREKSDLRKYMVSGGEGTIE